MDPRVCWRGEPGLVFEHDSIACGVAAFFVKFPFKTPWFPSPRLRPWGRRRIAPSGTFSALFLICFAGSLNAAGERTTCRIEIRADDSIIQDRLRVALGDAVQREGNLALDGSQESREDGDIPEKVRVSVRHPFYLDADRQGQVLAASLRLVRGR